MLHTEKREGLVDLVMSDAVWDTVAYLHPLAHVRKYMYKRAQIRSIGSLGSLLVYALSAC